MRCSAGYKKITGVYIGCVLIFLLLFPVVGHIGVTYCYAADPEQDTKIKESILSEFEYGQKLTIPYSLCSLKNGSYLKK